MHLHPPAQIITRPAVHAHWICWWFLPGWLYALVESTMSWPAIVGTVDRRGYDGQQEDTICDACRACQVIWSSTLEPVFHWFLLNGYAYKLLRSLWWHRQTTDNLITLYTPCMCAWVITWLLTQVYNITIASGFILSINVYYSHVTQRDWVLAYGKTATYLMYKTNW